MHFVCAVLAAGPGGLGFISNRLADFATIAVGRNHLGRDLCIIEFIVVSARAVIGVEEGAFTNVRFRVL